MEHSPTSAPGTGWEHTPCGLRHTWASRLTMNGVDAMVERYSHLSPDHLRSTVERLVAGQVRLARQAAQTRTPLPNLTPT